MALGGFWEPSQEEGLRPGLTRAQLPWTLSAGKSDPEADGVLTSSSCPGGHRQTLTGGGRSRVFGSAALNTFTRLHGHGHHLRLSLSIFPNRSPASFDTDSPPHPAPAPNLSPASVSGRLATLGPTEHLPFCTRLISRG